MHIVFVTCELATKRNSSGGLATFTANMARMFKNNGNTAEILWVTTEEVEARFDEDIAVHNLYIPLDEWKEFDYVSRLMGKDESDAYKIRITWQNVYKANMVRSKIREIHKQNRVDIVHFTNLCSYSLFMDRTIPYVTRISGFENIWFGGGDRVGGSLAYRDNPPSVDDRIQIHCMRKGGYVIAPSRLIAETGSQIMGFPVEVIESPFASDDFEYDASLFEEQLKTKNYILLYGTLSYLKGVHVAAHMANDFLGRHRDWYIVLAGNDRMLADDTDGEEMKASEYVKKHAGIYADRVIYVGRPVRERLYPVIRGAKLCMLPSRIENLSNSCIEAMSMGKIVVATDGGSYEQLIRDGENGYLCERDNADAFLKGIEKVLALTEEERQAISQKAKETAGRLSPQNLYPQYLAYYNKVIQEWDSGAGMPEADINALQKSSDICLCG